MKRTRPPPSLSHHKPKRSRIRFPLIVLSSLFIALHFYTFLRGRHIGHNISSPNIGGGAAPPGDFRAVRHPVVAHADSHPFSNVDVVMTARRASSAPDLYGTSETLPPWLSDYFAWHAARRREPSADDRFLVLSCAEGEHCGGLARRLGGIPYYLHLANVTGRILLVRWTAPMSLTEFLVSPEGGMDWTVPEGLDFDEEESEEAEPPCAPSDAARYFECVKERSEANDAVLALTPALSLAKTSSYFEKHCVPNSVGGDRGDGRAELDGEIFRILFEPSPPISKRIRETASEQNLITGKYVSAHFRFQYQAAYATYGTYLPNELAINAVRCASTLMMNAPVYFASDSLPVVKHVLDNSFYSRNVVGNITVHDVPEEFSYSKGQYPIHMASNQHRIEQYHQLNADLDDPVAFYPIFEDLLIMASGRCTAYGVGEYGLFAARLTGNLYSCSVQHQNEQGKPKSYCIVDGLEPKLSPNARKKKETKTAREEEKQINCGWRTTGSPQRNRPAGGAVKEDVRELIYSDTHKHTHS